MGEAETAVSMTPAKTDPGTVGATTAAPLPPSPQTRLTVKTLLPADIPRCVDIYLSAFAGNAHSLACFPRENPSVRRWWEDMLREEMTDPEAVFLKVEACLHHPGAAAAADECEKKTRKGDKREDIIAFAKWNRPKAIAEAADEEHDASAAVLLPAWPAGTDARLCEKTFGEWARAHRRLMGSRRRHWYLEMLATDPAHQGRGAGSLLLRHGCERADGDGVEAYLEASPEAVRMYERFGFREVDRHEVYVASGNVKREKVVGNGTRVGVEEDDGEVYVNVYMIRPATERCPEGA
ncbi:acyl-CoA N-acyltransferase [Microdochium bolleyi]|uniref:Acyl-CoA N-acyltransferase n=1 Tax=Microdochium bolleyi TaxID=196109 RepID=A0A136IYE5_9PEZI|nr:acyl-CoA N-acyltransferase [Microdochium bolleyi]